MNLYKVTFDNNEAVSSEQIYIPHYNRLRLGTVEGEPSKRTVVVYAGNEKESITVACRVVSDLAHFLKVA